MSCCYKWCGREAGASYCGHSVLFPSLSSPFYCQLLYLLFFFYRIVNNLGYIITLSSALSASLSFSKHLNTENAYCLWDNTVGYRNCCSLLSTSCVPQHCVQSRSLTGLSSSYKWIASCWFWFNFRAVFFSKLLLSLVICGDIAIVLSETLTTVYSLIRPSSCC